MRFGRSDNSRLRLTDHFHWYSPGLDLNDVGFLRQADVIANQVFLGWSEPTPRGAFRNYSVQLAREDQWDFGGLETRSSTGIEANSEFKNKWAAHAELSYEDVVDTRMLRGGPALRWHDYYEAELSLRTDQSRRVWASPFGSYSRARDDDSTAWSLGALVNLRLSNRLSLSGSTSYEQLLDNLQYVATAEEAEATRWVLGRIDQDTWSFTFRVEPLDHPGPDPPVLREPLHRHRPLRGVQEGDGHAGPGLRVPLPPVRPGGDRVPGGGQLLPGHGGRGRALLLLRQPRLQLPAVPLEPGGPLGVEARVLGLRGLVAGAHVVRPGVGRLVRLELGRAARGTVRQRLPRQGQLLVLAVVPPRAKRGAI